jgi:hypothetical protein
MEIKDLEDDQTYLIHIVIGNERTKSKPIKLKKRETSIKLNFSNCL